MRLLFILSLVLCLFISPARAQNQAPRHYAPLSMQNLSKLYWAIDRLDISNVKAIDNFMLINECELYKAYYDNELERPKIRESAKELIQSDISKFPLRFEFTLPLQFADYDAQKQHFEILEPYKVRKARLMDTQALDAKEEICGEKSEIEQYPRHVFLELNRPLTFENVPMPQERADLFIQERLKAAQERNLGAQSRDDIYDARDAHMVLNVKIYGYEQDRKSRASKAVAHLRGVLESIDIYDNQEKTELLYHQDIRVRRSDLSPLEKELQGKYKAAKDAGTIAPIDTLGD